MRLPEVGTKMKTNAKILAAEECGGFLVAPKHIESRRANADGVYKGWVPGAGGDIWWIEHEDGTVGAYVYNEVAVLGSPNPRTRAPTRCSILQPAPERGATAPRFLVNPKGDR